MVKWQQSLSETKVTNAYHSIAENRIQCNAFYMWNSWVFNSWSTQLITCALIFWFSFPDDISFKSFPWLLKLKLFSFTCSGVHIQITVTKKQSVWMNLPPFFSLLCKTAVMLVLWCTFPATLFQLLQDYRSILLSPHRIKKKTISTMFYMW